MNILDQLRGALVVSCQPVTDGPMDHPEITRAMAMAAQSGGAAGIRIEGIENLRAVRPHSNLPIIGIVKNDLKMSPVRITPHLRDVAALAATGADVIAYDATNRKRPEATSDLVGAIKSHNCLAMADCATLADAKNAIAEGAEIIGTTLSEDPANPGSTLAAPDFELIRQFAELGSFVMAEGRFNTPALAAQAMTAGADSVTVGSAITRIEIITGWFASAVNGQDGE